MFVLVTSKLPTISIKCLVSKNGRSLADAGAAGGRGPWRFGNFTFAVTFGSRIKLTN